MSSSSSASHIQKNTLGQRLLTARGRAHLSQEALAEALNVSVRSVQRWERDQAVPQGQSRAQLCQVLQVSSEILFGCADGERDVPPVEQPWVVSQRRNPFFTGRDELLHQLHATLSQQKRADLAQACVLTGLGGMGKTQLALEYAYRYAQSYSATFWVEAERYETIIASFATIASYLHLPEALEQDQQQMIMAVKCWLDMHSDWLLIMDNVEAIETIKAFVPTSNRGTLLLTTQHTTLGTFALRLEVPPMPTKESIVFLLRRVGLIPAHAVPDLEPDTVPQYVHASTIAKAMDGLPLALDQAGAYIDEVQCGLADFLELFRASPLQLLQERDLYADHPHSVAKVFALSLEKVRQSHPVAADLLVACSFLAPDSLPDRLFVEGGIHLGPTMHAVLASPLKFNTLLKTLLSYSLIHHNPQTKTITVHRLVQTVLKHIVSAEDQRFWMERVLHLLDSAFPAEYRSMEHWPWCEQLVPHILHVLQQYGEAEYLEPTFPHLLSLLTNTAAYLSWRGRYVESERVYQQLQALQEQLHGKIHEDVAETLSQLGKLAYRQGRYQDAGEAFQRSLSIHVSLMGNAHPQVSALLNNLGNIAFKQGKYADAETFFHRALSIRESTLGATHPHLSTPLNNLALLHYMQKRYKEAEKLLRRAILIREQEQEQESLETAYPLNTLAIVYNALGQYKNAEDAASRALRIREREQGQEHHDLAAPLSSLAEAFAGQGKYQEAESLYDQALSLLEKSFGQEHQEMVYCFCGLAKLSLRRELYTPAEAFLQRALDLQERLVGREHPDTIELLSIYAELSIKQGRHEQAAAYYKSALTMSERIFGAEHACTTALVAVHSLHISAKWSR